MYFSDDMRELILLFKKHNVDFAVCGGFAVAHHGFVRMTMDFDLLVNPSQDNSKKIMSALEEFGFGQVGVSVEDFQMPGTAVTLGEQPNQIDLLTSMSSVPAGEILDRAVNARIGEVEVKVVSYEDLIVAKQEASRPKDRIDLDELRRLKGDV
jgi:predicted nucleotidyltransferase